MKRILSQFALGFFLISGNVAFAQTPYDRGQDEHLAAVTEDLSRELAYVNDQVSMASAANREQINISLDIPIGTSAATTTQLLEYVVTGNPECKLVGIERVGDGHSDCVIGFSNRVNCSGVSPSPMTAFGCRRVGVVMRRYPSNRTNGEKRDVGGRCHVACTSSLVSGGSGMPGLSSSLINTYPIQRTGQ